MVARTMLPAEIADHVGHEIGVSDWVEVTQPMIDTFADATMDRQFIHIDAERAAATPFGGTIAHGFLTLSMLSHLANQALPKMGNAEMNLNYGLNRVRFLSPVRTGRRVRGRFVLAAVERNASDRLLQTYDVTVEINGESKPALVAQWLTLSILRLS